MKSAIVALSAAAALASATPIVSQVPQSAPFYLIAHSSNKSIDGSYFSAAHEGAGIEALAIVTSSGPARQFTLNQTYTDEKNFGVIAFNLPVNGDEHVSQALGLYTITEGSNVAQASFGNVNGEASFGFDAKERLYRRSYPNGKADNQRHWHVCRTTYEDSYTYESLNWVYGNAKPQNPTCQKVEVTRKFV